MKLKKTAAIVAAVTAMTFALSACGTKTSTTQTDDSSTKAAYPTKTIKVISMFGETRPPSKTAKMITDLIEKDKGWKFEYEYLEANNGNDAVNKVWGAPHDGYTVLAQTEALFSNSVGGISTQTIKNWIPFESYSAATVLVVKPDSPYKTLTDLVNAAKAKPGTIKLGHSMTSTSAFGLKARILERVSGAKFELVPTKPGVDVVSELVKGNVDALITPTASGSKPIIEGQLRVLAMTDAADHIFPEPVGKAFSVAKDYPDFANYMPMDAPQGLALPKDTPKEVVEAFAEAFEKAMNSPEIDAYIKAQDSIKLNISGDTAVNYLNKLESNMTWLIQELGLAKVNPETLGIQKPKWMK